MKKILSVLLSATIYCIALLNTANAQQTLAIASIPVKPAFVKTAFNEEKISVYKNSDNFDKANVKGSKADLKAAKANFKALKNFQKQFKDPAQVSWINYNDVIMARFKSNDVETSVAYNKQGAWLHTISYLDQNKIPQKIKSEVEYAYPDYNISGASEITEGVITFYLVYIENCTSIKQISVVNDEMGVYKEFKKISK